MQPNQASPVAAAEQLAAGGRGAEAVQLLDRAGAAGDAGALFTLAMWRLAGRHLPVDPGEARALFQRAGEAGHRGAAKIHVNFLASGFGGAADWPDAVGRLTRLAERDPASRTEVALIDAMKLTSDGGPASLPEKRTLSASPEVATFPGLFTRAECDYLARAAAPMLKPSVVVDPRSGRQSPHPIRTSDGAVFAWLLANPAVHALCRRIAAASGTRVAQGEPLQVLRYQPGQQYRSHLDAVSADGNRRVLTMIVYLNDGYQGGETWFGRTGLTIRGRTGDGLLFRNTLPDGRPDPMSEHAGLPVASGTKLIASRWIWEGDFAPA